MQYDLWLFSNAKCVVEPDPIDIDVFNKSGLFCDVDFTIPATILKRMRDELVRFFDTRGSYWDPK
jgi:hypothetical protein